MVGCILSARELQMSKQPLVSVFMPCYNQESLVSFSIEAVLEQDYDNIEIVIVDDCSTDNTWQVVKQYADQNPDKIKAYRNKINLGITKNQNKVLSLCSGEYISFYAGDDIYIQGKISAQVELMEENKDLIACYHDVEVFDSETNSTIRYWNHGENSQPAIIGTSEHLAKKMIEGGTGFLSALTIMIKKEFVPVAGYDERVLIASDWLMWVEFFASNQGRVEFIPKVYARYRKHENNITNSCSDYAIEDNSVSLALIESKYPKLIASVRKAKAKQHYRRSIVFHIEGKNELAYLLMKESIKQRITYWKGPIWLVKFWLLKNFG